jgi:hypothetical protein
MSILLAFLESGTYKGTEKAAAGPRWLKTGWGCIIKEVEGVDS